MSDMENHSSQIQAVSTLVQTTLGSRVLAIYLHGSAVAGGLQVHSDLDLLAVVDIPLGDAQRQALITALLTLSSPHPAIPGGSRCIELVLCRHSDLLSQDYPAKVEFIYGEWLREASQAGTVPEAESDPEYTLLLAQARQQARLLWGKDLLSEVPPTSLGQIRQAMRDGLEPLLSGLQGDERNVLLTLARMWRTAVHGDFVSKEQGAAWAISQLAPAPAETLDYARRAYQGEVADQWADRFAQVQQLAQDLAGRIKQAL